MDVILKLLQHKLTILYTFIPIKEQLNRYLCERLDRINIRMSAQSACAHD